MLPHEIVSRIMQDQIDPHWIIFHYNKKRSVFMLLYKLFFTAFVGGMGVSLLALSQSPFNDETKYTAYPLIAVGAIGMLVLLHHIYTMFFLKSNMIVLTENGVVKSVRGKTFFWEYKNMTDVKQVVSHMKNSMPVYSIEFREANGNGRIFELARGREFGPSQNIYEVLKTKV